MGGWSKKHGDLDLGGAHVAWDGTDMAEGEGQNGFLENAGRSFSLNELLRLDTSTNGVLETCAKDDTLPRVGQIQLQVLVILLPRYYNPDGNGKRVPVERSAFEQTFAEIRQYCSGFRLYEGQGWCHGLRFRGDFDEHIRIEIEAVLSDADVVFLKNWKRQLEIRFRQDSIYMSLYGPVSWL